MENILLFCGMLSILASGFVIIVGSTSFSLKLFTGEYSITVHPMLLLSSALLLVLGVFLTISRKELANDGKNDMEKMECDV